MQVPNPAGCCVNVVGKCGLPLRDPVLQWLDHVIPQGRDAGSQASCLRVQMRGNELVKSATQSVVTLVK